MNSQVIPKNMENQAEYSLGNKRVVVTLEIDPRCPSPGSKFKTPQNTEITILGRKVDGIGLLLAEEEKGNINILPFFNTEGMKNKGYRQLS